MMRQPTPIEVEVSSGATPGARKLLSQDAGGRELLVNATTPPSPAAATPFPAPVLAMNTLCQWHTADFYNSVTGALPSRPAGSSAAHLPPGAFSP